MDKLEIQKMTSLNRQSILKKIFISLIFVLTTQTVHSICFVQQKLDCSAAGFNLWETKSLTARLILLSSSTVQTDPLQCDLFASLLKTECSIQDPIHYLYIDSNNVTDSRYLVETDPSLFNRRATLPMD